MTPPTAATPPPTKLQDGEKRVYGVRVQDKGPAPRKWDGKWHRVLTHENPNGQWGTRAWAEDVLERALSNDKDLVGHTFDEVIHAEPTLETIKVDDWLYGNVVAIADVPAKYRDDYRNTLRRAALAAYRYGNRVYVSSSFRTLAEQQAAWATYLAGGPLAAYPGSSPHEHGVALDIPNARNTPALIRELRKLGMIDNVASEIWHVENTTR